MPVGIRISSQLPFVGIYLEMWILGLGKAFFSRANCQIVTFSCPYLLINKVRTRLDDILVAC